MDRASDPGDRKLWGVEVGEAREELEHKVLDVVVGERLLRVDDVVQVGVEQLGHEVDVLPVLDPASVGHHDVLEAQHVLVLEVLQQPHLPQHALAVDRVLEGGELGVLASERAALRDAPEAVRFLRTVPARLPLETALVGDLAGDQCDSVVASEAHAQKAAAVCGHR